MEVDGAGGDRGQLGLMSCHDHSPALHERVQGRDDCLLGVMVEADGGFVEQHDGRIDEQGTGDADPLALAARQTDAAV